MYRPVSSPSIKKSPTMYVDTDCIVPDIYTADCQTPLTPSSVFLSSTLHGEQNLIQSVVLCYWDNVLGPRIKHLWHADTMTQLSNSLALELCTKSLSGEICRELNDSGIDYKFYLIAEKRLMMLALVFSTMSNSDMHVDALLLVMPMEQRVQYLHKHELLLLWFKRIISKLKVYFCRDTVQNAVNLVTDDLRNLFEMLSTLHVACLPADILIEKTAFDVNYVIDADFLRKSLTSHLCTMSRSVVIGSNLNDINTMLSTLAIFNSETERMCSRYLTLNTCNYHHDLWLQGLNKGTGDLSLLTTEILSSQYPTTMIDLDNHDVFQSLACPDHFIWQHDTRVSELTALYFNDSEKLSYPKSTFSLFDQQETLVQSFLSEFDMLEPGGGLQESYIAHFKMALNRRALALIKYIEADTNKGASPLRVNVKTIRQDLGLTLEGNFRIIMAVAEKMKPGLYSFLLSDNDVIPSYLTPRT